MACSYLDNVGANVQALHINLYGGFGARQRFLHKYPAGTCFHHAVGNNSIWRCYRGYVFHGIGIEQELYFRFHFGGSYRHRPTIAAFTAVLVVNYREGGRVVTRPAISVQVGREVVGSGQVAEIIIITVAFDHRMGDEEHHIIACLHGAEQRLRHGVHADSKAGLCRCAGGVVGPGHVTCSGAGRHLCGGECNSLSLLVHFIPLEPVVAKGLQYYVSQMVVSQFSRRSTGGVSTVTVTVSKAGVEWHCSSAALRTKVEVCCGRTLAVSVKDSKGVSNV